jgi:hypothetical protein
MKSDTIRLERTEWKYIADILESVGLPELANKIRQQLQSVSFEWFDFGDDPLFQEAWVEWMSYRKERKLNKYAPSTLKKLNKTFVAWGINATIDSINQSIEKGYQGLFEVAPKKKAINQFDPNDRSDWIGAFKFIHPYDEEPKSWDEVPKDDQERIKRIIRSRKN